VTIITHGLNGDADGWVTGMAEQIPNYSSFSGTNYSFYKVYFVSAAGGGYQLAWSRLGGDLPSITDSGEIIVAFDWSQLADGNSYNTYQIASVLSQALTSTNFISELNGHALCEMPIHLIGHSRGGSVMCETSRLLGTNGVWVDHLTTLDPHPLNDSNFPLDGLRYSAVDAPCATYENVLFHDNYWQNIAFVVYGESVAGAYIRQLTYLTGGYSSDHSNVHLWYHGTVDERNPADDTEAQLTSTEFSTWYTPNENYGYDAGFKWSLIGGGDRTSNFQPEGTGYPVISDGYNQAWDLGAGQAGNRTLLPSNSGDWPNVMKFNLVSTKQIQQGSNALFSLYYQWAQPNTSNATVSLYLDDDFNPNNGNSHLIKQTVVSGTGTSGSSISFWISSSPLSAGLNPTNAPVGYHSLYAKITGGGKTRYLYAPEIIQVLPAIILTTQPTNQTVWAGTNVTFSLTALGVPTLKYQWRKNGVGIVAATNANYSINNVPTNAAGIYSCVVSNAFGNAVSSNAALIVLAPDTTKPTNVMTAPISGQRWSNEVFTVTGKAGDNMQVSNVWYQINGSDWNLATTENNWSNWTAQVTLTPGTNIIAAYSVDTSGNVSSTNTVKLVYVQTALLTVQVFGQGTITPNYNNAALQIGNNYKMAAKAAKGFAFRNWMVSTNWIDGVIIISPTVQFMMASNLTLQAVFADVAKPVLKIVKLASKQTVSTVTLKGTASDNVQVTNVFFQLNGGGWTSAATSNQWANWSANLNLVSGANKVSAYAVDASGNLSTTATLSLQFTAPKASVVAEISLPATTNIFAITDWSYSTNGFNFTLQSSSALNGHIQVSTNLTSWVTLTNFIGTNATLNFRDASATNSSQRFYRAVIP